MKIKLPSPSSPFCLLISEVVKDSKEEAKVIADRIKLLSDQKELKIDVVNRIIDAVINLNMTQNQPVIILIRFILLFCLKIKFQYIWLRYVFL